MKKARRILTAALALTLCGAILSGCGETSTATDGGNGNTKADGDLIKVGIINNDPNESGYRTANVNDLKNTFTKETALMHSFPTALRMTSRSGSLRNIFRMRSITSSSPLRIPQAGIPFFRMRRMQA
jgi:hypothetical protein